MHRSISGRASSSSTFSRAYGIGLSLPSSTGRAYAGKTTTDNKSAITTISRALPPMKSRFTKLEGEAPAPIAR
jgi:hypothetical protein